MSWRSVFGWIEVIQSASRSSNTFYAMNKIITFILMYSSLSTNNQHVQLKIERNPIVEKNWKAVPRIYGLKRQTMSKAKSRLLSSSPNNRQIRVEQELLEVIRMRMTPYGHQTPKQIISAKQFQLRDLSDRVPSPVKQHSEPQGIKPQKSQSERKDYNEHNVLKRLRKKSPLPYQQQTSHKVVRRYKTSMQLPSLDLKVVKTEPSEDYASYEPVPKKPTKLSQLKERVAKGRPRLQPSFFIEQDDEQQYQSGHSSLQDYLVESSQSGSVFQKKIEIKNLVETKEVATSIETVSVNVRSFKANTYFYELNAIESDSKIQESRIMSYRTSVDSRKFEVPTKQQIPEFIANYRPMDIAFDLQTIVKSKQFQVKLSKGYLYLGEQQDGKPHGYGLLLSDKGIYEGEFEKGQKVKGTHKTSEGVYAGHFLNGLRHGQGRFEWNNKNIYEGQWRHGMKNGKGMWSSPNGDSYEGEWNNNKQQGIGVHTTKTSTYSGQFVNFRKQGTGKQTFLNGDTYEGQYSDGKPNGNGNYLWRDGSRYSGEFVNGLRSGLGVMEKDGDIYRGTLFLDLSNVGDYKNDVKDGSGQIFFKDGSSFKGIFRDDKPTTDGQYRCPDGSPAIIQI